jgi:lipid-A-disaccharide synthase
MHLFFSVGDPSGDQHAAHLIEELHRQRRGLKLAGFGGPRMQQAGCELLFPMTDIAVMGFADVLPFVWTFFRLIRQCGRYLRTHRPDAVVLVDFPGFNWWVAWQAKRCGIPVFYYLPPQLWAWAPWRIRKVRRYVDHVLSALAFEADWYRARGVAVEFVGHPFFDDVARHQLDLAFLAQQKSPGQSVLALLPGSRRQEVLRNWPVMLEVIARLHARHPQLRFPVACYKPAYVALCQQLVPADLAQLPLEYHVGKTPEIIEAADCCLMVSGSVSLELLARATPGVVLYRGSWLIYVLAHLLITCRYMTLVNLLAGRELMPEFPFVRRPKRHAARMAAVLDRWISVPSERRHVVAELAELRERVARTGGTACAAASILNRLGPREGRAAA